MQSSVFYVKSKFEIERGIQREYVLKIFREIDE